MALSKLFSDQDQRPYVILFQEEPDQIITKFACNAETIFSDTTWGSSNAAPDI